MPPDPAQEPLIIEHPIERERKAKIRAKREADEAAGIETLPEWLGGPAEESA